MSRFTKNLPKIRQSLLCKTDISLLKKQSQTCRKHTSKFYSQNNSGRPPNYIFARPRSISPKIHKIYNITINLLKSIRIDCHILREIYRKFGKVFFVKQTSPYKSRVNTAQKTHFKISQPKQLRSASKLHICSTEINFTKIHKTNNITIHL